MRDPITLAKDCGATIEDDNGNAPMWFVSLTPAQLTEYTRRVIEECAVACDKVEGPDDEYAFTFNNAAERCATSIRAMKGNAA
jgi:hypothetical protein